ncbi:MAG: phosphonate ABC transporter substrate-binding protein [Bacillus thermozeamaize]|uniref:Phosphonate ABC transporter substrate-binding protein n=1 Tax=Bacillus thermozeamaize TaxID=230954 RepID=A0A1Y3PXI1_9BACI|nr:MAG: phosphonate ABC transporter substrate-binding protein [Bacillus thermozeamaize]
MKKKIRFFACLAFVTALVFLLPACGSGGQPDAGQKEPASAAKGVFTFGIIPAETDIPEETLRKLEHYLSEKLGREVKAATYPNYNGVVEALNYGKLDMAYLGPLTYVLANHESGVQAIVAKTFDGKPYYHSLLIAPADSPYDSIEDVVAHASQITFAFGDPNSTSGSLVPSIQLKELGVYNSPDDHKFKKVIFTGAHNVTALSVASKQVDVGAIDSAYFQQMIKDGKVKESDYKVIWQSEKLFQYPFAVKKGTDEATVAKLQAAFMSIKDEAILKAFAADGFVEASDQDYEAIRQAAMKDGRIK